MNETPNIVVTDAPREVAPRTDCPNCTAPATARTASNGFGGSFNELCGKCGYNFGPKERHGQ
jgi:hypothetical protein